MKKRITGSGLSLFFFAAFNLAAFNFCHGEEENLALEAMVSTGCQTVSGCHYPGYAVDGSIDKAKALWFGPCPCWFQVDLGEVKQINKIHIYPYWGDNRYYQYYLEASTDGREWKKVADASRKTEPETEKGSIYEFAPVKARFVRVTFTFNSASIANVENTFAHLVELQVFGVLNMDDHCKETRK